MRIFLAALIAISWLTSGTLCSQQSKGSVLQIIDIVNGTYVLYDDTLKSILAKVPPSTELGIISIGGEYRKGKSFLLNFFLQYLQYRERNDTTPDIVPEDQLEQVIEEGSHPWLRDIEKNSGFQFKAGTVRETTGINIWSEPFLIRTKDGKRIAVFVVDSQGLYDEQTSKNDNVRLFTMVSMMSSTLMVNVGGNINFNHFLELQYFLTYAASSDRLDSSIKRLQTMTFVIRDYTLGDTFGWESGQEILNQFVKIDNSQSPEVRQVAKNLTTGFKTMNAFTFPNPGKKVTAKSFDGKLSKIDTDFLEQLQSFVVKTVDDVQPKNDMIYNLTAENFLNYTHDMVVNFNANLPPDELMRLQEASVLQKIRENLESVIYKYIDHMRDFIRGQSDESFKDKDRNYISASLRNEHESYTSNLLKDFAKRPTSKLNIAISTSGKPEAALQILTTKLSERFKEMSPDLVELAVKKGEMATLLERKLKATKEEEKRKIQIQIDNNNKKRRQIEEQDTAKTVVFSILGVVGLLAFFG